MKFNYEKRAYKAYLLQWDGVNFNEVVFALSQRGYSDIGMHGDTIMARGSGKSLLCVHLNNWLRVGQNGSFKVMRPDEKETYVPIIEPSLDHVDLARQIITQLGWAVSPSREPGADLRVDKIARMIEGRCPERIEYENR